MEMRVFITIQQQPAAGKRTHLKVHNHKLQSTDSVANNQLNWVVLTSSTSSSRRRGECLENIDFAFMFTASASEARLLLLPCQGKVLRNVYLTMDRLHTFCWLAGYHTQSTNRPIITKSLHPFQRKFSDP